MNYPEKIARVIFDKNDLKHSTGPVGIIAGSTKINSVEQSEQHFKFSIEFQKFAFQAACIIKKKLKELNVDSTIVLTIDHITDLSHLLGFSGLDKNNKKKKISSNRKKGYSVSHLNPSLYKFFLNHVPSETRDEFDSIRVIFESECRRQVLGKYNQSFSNNDIDPKLKALVKKVSCRTTACDNLDLESNQKVSVSCKGIVSRCLIKTHKYAGSANKDCERIIGIWGKDDVRTHKDIVIGGLILAQELNQDLASVNNYFLGRKDSPYSFQIKANRID